MTKQLTNAIAENCFRLMKSPHLLFHYGPIAVSAGNKRRNHTAKRSIVNHSLTLPIRQNSSKIAGLMETSQAQPRNSASLAPVPGRFVAPRISVVMPTYNGERFLRPAIESILSQTFRDFELIAIDDGSTDGTAAILREFADRDDRVTLLSNERNLGIAGATNRGLAAARGEFVALHDHDDISLPHRFQTEIDFLRSHADLTVVGSAATLIDENGSQYAEFPLPCDEIDIKWRLLFWGDAFHYTSLMVRRSALQAIGGYGEDTAFRYAEAYDPFGRLAMGHHMVNLPEKLVLWRRHPSATSFQRQQEQLRSGEVISERNIALLGDLGRRYRDLHHCIAGLRAFTSTPAGHFPVLPAQQVIDGLGFVRKLQKNFYRAHGFSRAAIAQHRRPLYWIWGKHAVALALRAPWPLRERLTMLSLGLRCLCGWVRLVFNDATVGKESKLTVPTTIPLAVPSEQASWTEAP
jgi:glycosyltransferase involved in cell wall biosynthesis